MLFRSLDDLQGVLAGVMVYDHLGVSKIENVSRLRSDVIDKLVYNAIFQRDTELKSNARFAIRTAAELLGIFPASIQELYVEKGRKRHMGFTVPAINIRGLTYDTARSVFQVMLERDVGPVIFEIARSEIGYTEQWPSEYAVVILAAAIREGYRGPVFLQGDHFQVKAKLFHQDPEMEIGAIKLLIRDAISSGFFNIDIDTSTLVDLTKDTLGEQQRLNYELCALFTSYIRTLEPDNITVSVGGEIGEVGGKNSTPEELKAFMEGYTLSLKKTDPYLDGLSKISVQTGTTHGGVPLPDGTIAKVNLDFDILQRLSRMARDTYGLAGAVQHGASTLPEEMFHRFPETGTAEIHLATGFQNIVLDNHAFPATLRREMYDYLQEHFANERKEGQTVEQFFYKTRKKAFGPFKKHLCDLPGEILQVIRTDLHDQFDFLFGKLKVIGTRSILRDLITPPDCRHTLDRERELIK